MSLIPLNTLIGEKKNEYLQCKKKRSGNKSGKQIPKNFPKNLDKKTVLGN